MDILTVDDADPDERRPAGPLYVPVRLGSAGGQQLRFVRTPLGVRSAVGFTSAARLHAVLGAGQCWIRLAEPALRALAAPLGVTTLTLDPQLMAPAPSGARRTPAAHPCARRSAPPEPLPAAPEPEPVPALAPVHRAARLTAVPALVDHRGGFPV
ncbi:SAV_915 family protein [Streptomyces sp. cg36]|uniref:SAV_915 family protein n=1 Tax=Streptomyces sp. cg36 TaxID=3238798 RepID=UPI0034E2EE6A